MKWLNSDAAQERATVTTPKQLACCSRAAVAVYRGRGKQMGTSIESPAKQSHWHAVTFTSVLQASEYIQVYGKRHLTELT
jgi:hypothetical protein